MKKGRWYGVCDNKHMLLTVCYGNGILCVRFNTGTSGFHMGVPERIYEILLRSKFAGSYYRKYVRDVYPYTSLEAPAVPMPFNPDPAGKLERMTQKRIEKAVKEDESWGLFGPMK
jgi:KTSC domain